MRTLILSLILVLFVSACSRKTNPGRAAGTALPRFSLTGRDLASPVEMTTNTLGSTGSVVMHIKLSPGKAEELRRFTEEHVNQYVEIMGGSTVIMKALVHDPISGGDLNVSFGASDPSAQAIADFLNKK